MAFNFNNPLAGPSSQGARGFQPQHRYTGYGSPSMMDHQADPANPTNPANPGFGPPGFDLLNWYNKQQSCHRYFLDVAQHTAGAQALTAFVNILLPCQRNPPIMCSNQSSPRPPHEMGGQIRQQGLFPNTQPVSPAPAVSLIPYIRRLVATGQDAEATLHGLFGNDWEEGVGTTWEVERRNYLFASKSADWLIVKQQYDMSPQETCPFLMPLRNAKEHELANTDLEWSKWLSMQDWMLGPREFQRPEGLDEEPRYVRSPRVKEEPRG